VELGLLFGLARGWTGSLWAGIAMHAAHNLASTAVLYLSPDPMAELNEPFAWTESALMGAASLVGTLVLLRVLRRWPHDEPERRPLGFSPAPAGRLLAGALALAAAAVAALVLWGSRLPGAELRSILRGEDTPPADTEEAP
jgi:hypothetical protein